MRVGTLARLSSLAVLSLALWIAHSPHLLLLVPNIGFVLYSSMGGYIPGYFDWKIFAYEHLWQRKGDIIVSTCTKCGTTWMLQTAHHMRFKGHTPEFSDLHKEVRWLEFVYYPGQPMRERVEILRRHRDEFQVSVFKTHFQPPLVNVRDDAKYIVSLRSMPDVAASLRQFFPNHDVHFARMWGGFPVTAGKEVIMDEKEQALFEHMFLTDVGNGHPLLDVVALDLIKGWWPHRRRKNVLFVHYSDRIRDHRGSLKRIAEFLEIQMTPEEFELVVEKTSFESMKKEAHKYDFGDCFNEFKNRGLVAKEMKTVVKDLVQVGPGRSGSRELPATFVEAIKQRVEEELGPSIAKYLLEGGQIPLEAELPTKRIP